VAWLVAFIAVGSVARAVGTSYANDFTMKGTESADAYQLLRQVSPALSGDNEQIVFESLNGTSITDPAIVAKINATLNEVVAVKFSKPGVTFAVVSPVPVTVPGAVAVRVNPEQISQSGHIAFATVTLNVLAQHFSQRDAQHFVSAATSQSGGNLIVAVTGQLAQQAERPSLSGLLFGGIAALIVLLLVFGSAFAALMPLASALLALGTATSLIGIITHVLKMPEFAPQLVGLIGLGVGVDYALFIVSRHRQGLLEGKSTEESIVQSVNTSGRAVLFAGVIVCIALLGMYALQVNFLEGLAAAASIGVAFTMIAALTLLPAMLSFVGPRILSRRQRSTLATTGPRTASATPGFWSRWSTTVDRRPVIPFVVALCLIGMLAAPFLSIRLGFSDQGNDPRGSTTRTAYDLLARGFGPGFNGALQVVAKVSTPEQLAALDVLADRISTTPGVDTITRVPPIPVPGEPGASVVIIHIIPTTPPQASATTDLVNHLRHEVIPVSIGNTKAVVLVGGFTAIFIDFSNVLASKLPLFIGLVVLTSFLLLAIVFRSLLVPAISAVMNLLSIAAAFGILVAVFQWGYLGDIVGVNRVGPVEAFLPVMMFAILFGLSMDYQVFLVSRMHEEWLRSGDNRTAVRLGLARTGKTITAAALIMIVVFASFILGGQRIIKEFGVGLAAGVAVDAIVIRMAIVPAVMHIFGKANWWYPKWLDRVTPRVGLEDPDEFLLSDETSAEAQPEPV
jgi:RND superfamily putative drug exporter